MGSTQGAIVSCLDTCKEKIYCASFWADRNIVMIRKHSKIIPASYIQNNNKISK
jgi:hypothetical protein